VKLTSRRPIFWLSGATPARPLVHARRRFRCEVRRRFLDLWRASGSSELSSWEASDDGALALVIVLDQFPRNLFRGDIRTYASDALAHEVAHRAVERGVDARIDPALAGIPLSAVHAFGASGRPVALHRAVAGGRPCRNAKWAEHHADIIRRFGRFPHRNRLLGRATTPEEQAFLDEGGFSP
jgi:uncharacterized protein (DUF924 family)